jgi:hypothetical protein
MIIEAVISLQLEGIIAAVHAKVLLEIDRGADQSIESIEPDGALGVTDQEALRLLICAISVWGPCSLFGFPVARLTSQKVNASTHWQHKEGPDTFLFKMYPAP